VRPGMRLSLCNRSPLRRVGVPTLMSAYGTAPGNKAKTLN